MKSNIRVGLVGLAQARHFVEMFHRLADVRVMALCDINRQTLDDVGQAHNIAARFTDFDAMLAEDIDLVVLSTPIQAHGPQATAALRAGKHVLCQYIAAMDEREARDLVDAAKKTSAKYMTIETDCYEPANLMMMRMASDGTFGELTTGRGHYIHDCKSLGRDLDGTLTWRGQMWSAMLGGKIAAIHNSLPLLKCFGERVVEVSAFGTGARTAPQYTMHDRVIVIARLRCGRILEFVTDVLSNCPHVFGYQLQGTRGCWEFNRAYLLENGRLSAAKALDELDRQHAVAEAGAEPDHAGHGSAWEQIIRKFVQCVREDLHPPQDLYDALEMTAIGWAAEESLATGRAVRVPSFE